MSIPQIIVLFVVLQVGILLLALAVALILKRRNRGQVAPYAITAPNELKIQRRLTTTAFQLDGYRTVTSLGVVRGITVRSRSVFGTLGGLFQTLLGGNITLFTQLCEDTREEAFALMLEHAAREKANAVIGVRYDGSEVSTGVNEVMCYGTAVVVESAAVP